MCRQYNLLLESVLLSRVEKSGGDSGALVCPQLVSLVTKSHGANLSP